LGKVADVVQNLYGRSLSIVPTELVLEETLKIIREEKTAFICANVQETDLSGHLESSERYKKVLEIADKGIGKIMKELTKEDILIVMADHGNDPLIGHPHHTREKVPLLIQCRHLIGTVGERKTLSDVAATAAEFFKVLPPENGESIQEIL